MKSEWREVPVKELGEIVTGKTPRTKIEENFGGTIPFLTPSDNMTAKYVRSTKRTLSKQGVAEVSNKVLPANSIAVSCIGSDLGKVVMTTGETVTNQQINSIIPSEFYDPDFIYYSMKILGEKLNFLSKTSTAVPIINKTQFSNESILVPSLLTQKAIAKTLSCLDAKIEVNNRIIENLEAQAQAIFKSWFIDFEPFQEGQFVESELGMIPSGWCVKSLDEIADFANGLAMQRYRPQVGESSLPVVKIKELRQRFTDENSDRCSKNINANSIIENGDIIFSWSGSLLVDVWTGGKSGLNQHLFKVTSDQYPSWFYFQWTKFHLGEFQNIATSRATTMGHIKRSHLSEAKVLVPTKRQSQEINGIMEPILSAKITRRIENQTLATLRDTLLPKLMSGEIEVPIDQ